MTDKVFGDGRVGAGPVVGGEDHGWLDPGDDIFQGVVSAAHCCRNGMPAARGAARSERKQCDCRVLRIKMSSQA
jgi:hypothetical protein